MQATLFVMLLISRTRVETTIQLSLENPVNPIWRRPEMKHFSFIQRWITTEQFVISNQPRKRSETASWVGFIVEAQAFLSKSLCLLMKIIYWISFLSLSFPCDNKFGGNASDKNFLVLLFVQFICIIIWHRVRRGNMAKLKIIPS